MAGELRASGQSFIATGQLLSAAAVTLYSNLDGKMCHQVRLRLHLTESASWASHSPVQPVTKST